MSEGILDKILAERREQVAEQMRTADLARLKDRALYARVNSAPRRFHTELCRNGRTNIIAEIKRASPSKGIINPDVDVASLARQYHDGGACALSVLTEEKHFRGSAADLLAARAAVDLPILRKDFVVDEFQIYEAAAIGADAILLITAALSEGEIAEFLDIAQNELGMDAIVEVHDKCEFEIAKKVGARIIGVNNRNLKTFQVSLDVSRHLAGLDRPSGTLMIAESGISTRDEIEELRGIGFNGFLIGETLMRSHNPTAALSELTRNI